MSKCRFLVPVSTDVYGGYFCLLMAFNKRLRAKKFIRRTYGYQTGVEVTKVSGATYDQLDKEIVDRFLNSDLIRVKVED